MDFGDIFEFLGSENDTIQGLMSLYGIYDSVTNANAAAGSLEGLTDDQIARANQISALYTEGGDVLRTNIESLLEEYGSFGQVTPDVVDAFTKYFAEQRASEESGNETTVDDMTSEDKTRLMGFENAFRGYMQDIISGSEADVYGADSYGKSTAPDTLDYAQLQDDLTMKFYGLRKQMSDRAIAVQQSKVNASLPAGLENSTLAVQSARSMADLASERAGEDLMSAIGDAQNYISGLQNAASNQQNMTNAERNMQRNLLADVLNNAGTEANIDLTGSAYGQDYASNLNAQRGTAIGELSSLQGMRNNTAISDYLTGLNATSAANTTANDYLTQVGQISTSPYTYAAGGMTNTTNPGATLSALTSLTNQYAKIAGSNMAGAGDWLSSLKV